MKLLHSLATDPMAVLAGCFIWVLVVAWVLSAIGWIVTGEIDALTGIVVLGLAIGLGMVTIAPPVPGLGVWIFLGAVVTTLMFPFVRKAMTRRAMMEIDLEQIQRLCEGLKTNPGNTGALWRLAQLTYHMGLQGQAFKIAETAVDQMPRKLFPAEHREFDQWKAAVRPSVIRPAHCIGCSIPLTAGTVWCPSCGRAHILDLARGRWFGPNTANKLIGVWALALIALVGLPLAGSLASVSVPLAVGSTVGLIAVGVVMFVHLLSGHGGTR
ncbi:MAG: hypothetical protein KF884_06875 [Fimbriimonadaceae bacterium]|nr:hypothetical protein [Fimbriimonadaceae bacterium]QYK57272.1 MAG: hypothetical protein KF884_06875 [Fimbriimonadaceae bacterium]